MTAPGPLGDEARALVEAARDWAARTFGGVGTHLSTCAPECQWCPVCRAVAALRAPETTDRIAGAVTVAAGALASVLDALTRPPAPPRYEPGPAEPGPAEPGPAEPGPAESGPAGLGPGPYDVAPAAYDVPIDEDP
jgi:hypothetical protein